MIDTILLDMDDVLVDFTNGAMAFWGVDNYDVLDCYPKGIGRDITMAYECVTGLRIDEEIWWEHFKREAWANMPPSPDCCRIVDWARDLVGYENVYLCTTPTRCGECMAGKLDWIKKNLGPWAYRNYIMTPKKFVCARPGTLLVDDCDRNVELFKEWGGEAVIWPRPWNEGKVHSRDPFGFLEMFSDQLT